MQYLGAFFLLSLLAVPFPSAQAAAPIGKITCEESSNAGPLTIYFDEHSAVIKEMPFRVGYGEGSRAQNLRLRENGLSGWDHLAFEGAAPAADGTGQNYFYSVFLSKRAVSARYEGPLNQASGPYFLTINVGKSEVDRDHLWLKNCLLTWPVR